jgi:hypothetical protein
VPYLRRERILDPTTTQLPALALEPILWLVAASSLAGFAYLVVRLIGG